MRSSLAVILTFILIFGIAQGGLGIYRLFAAQYETRQALLQIGRDALELTMDDAYRMEHLTLCDPEEAKACCLEFIQRNPRTAGLKNLRIHAQGGTGEAVGELRLQHSLPQLEVWGTITVEIGILYAKRQVEIPVHVQVHARRVV